ncbi:hypothetical protein N7414_19520 [Pseudomonas sp. GD04087]|uniref:McrB family protein n=2 Tax=Bacteria TaxID=2 RepID=UPI0024482226|nr:MULTISPECIES: hypothetical protein [unclassified Pseudomonas]MDH0291318.1 hypothetical protein [Pseudomonas sp. GD04087]MDH1052662.1 hypothetical protein [Pseudomonas sp. GD03903]MDH2001553.1 hypothetical protein [Pseudomonas sp. GD03691]
MVLNLKDDAQLKQACDTILQQTLTQKGNRDWVAGLLTLLQEVRDVDEPTFFSERFQRNLWDSEQVTSTGMGQVDISKVAQDTSVIEQLWRLKNRFPGLERAQQELLVTETWNALITAITPLVKRFPKLKMYRVFAVLCPGFFTTIGHSRKLRELASAMGAAQRGESRQLLHRKVLDRLDDVLGPAADIFTTAGVERMTLPWLLYVTYVQRPEQESTELADPETGKELLNPLPAERRRRGLLSIGGGIATILAMIEFAREGCTREDFMQHLQSLNPAFKKSSLSTQLNALIAEWGVLRAQGTDLQLTPRGEALLESGEPDEVIDWMITRILGFDNLLLTLKHTPLSTQQANDLLRQVNPGWTSNFAPSALVSWLRSLALVELDGAKLLRLTDRGEEWVARIHWTPGALKAIPIAAGPGDLEAPRAASSVKASRPALMEIIKGFAPEIQFPPELIAQLDAGLWSHFRRHLAVLTGLSGAGKTQLARGYALSLWQQTQDPHEGLLIVPVQPGWHDPSALLGYVNPLEADTYVRTACLDFLLRASADPASPYTLILDEMNLSHPEQYLAPLLSAMETGDHIELHALGDGISDVPTSIPYPANLLIIGTVNMDETTHGLSDKVLDRAAVIEFWDIDVEAFPGWATTSLPTEQITIVRSLLTELVQALRPMRLHFGWRTLHDVIGYLQEAANGQVISFNQALDHAVYAKVLPKLRGEDSPRLQKVFQEVLKVLTNVKLEASKAKVTEMLDDLHHLGSARFWR